MPASVLPRWLRPRLQPLAELPDARFDALIAAAGEDRCARSLQAVAADAASASGLPVTDMEAVVDGVFALIDDAQACRRDVSDIIDEAVAGSGLDAELRLCAAGRLKRIAGSIAVRMLHRAAETAGNNSHVFRGCRVLTDARLVDDPDNETRIGAMCVIHKLKIDYEDSSGRLSSFYVTLNREHLTALVAAAGRGVLESIKTERMISSVVEVAASP